VFAGLWVYWHLCVPSPGKAVAMLAVVAAVMSIRDLSGFAKVCWVVLLFGFLLIEVKSIDNDRAEHDRRQAELIKEEREHFGEIGRGIETAIQKSDEHFTATMKKSDALVSASTRAVEMSSKSLGEITGGKSFAVVIPVLATPIHNGMEFPLSVSVQGRYPLSDVWIQRVDIDPSVITRQQAEAFFENRDAWGPRSHIGVLPLRTGPILSLTISPKADKENVFLFTVDARNGATSEKLKVRKNPNTGIWEYSLDVTDGEGKLLLSQPWAGSVSLGRSSSQKR
jgi:hypothetical protein